MNIDYIFLADHAVVPPDGKVYVNGGGFTALAVQQLPARVMFAVVAGFRFAAGDVGTTIRCEVRLVDDVDGLVVPPIPLQFQLNGAPAPDGRDLTIPAVSFMSPMFAEPGQYRVQMWNEAELLHTIKLPVEEQQPPHPGERPN
jgi:hypothetical protein